MRLSYDHIGTQVRNLTVISEDRNSANNILLAIIDRYAKNNRLNIELTFITSDGVGGVMNKLNDSNIINTKTNNLIVIIDNATEQKSTIMNIQKRLRALHRLFGIKTILFNPLCIEECVLSYRTIKNDINNLTTYEKRLLDIAYLHSRRGQYANLVRYNAVNNSYYFDGNKIDFSKCISVLPKKKPINNIERYLANELAKLTTNRPYRFIKSADPCYYKSCESNITGKCVLDQLLGLYRPNSPTHYCNRTMIGKDKIENLLSNSFFGCIYDSLDILLGQNTLKYATKSAMDYTVRRYF